MASANLPIEKIRQIYANYSLKDIAESLFITSIWLPNIASSLKQLFATSVIVTMEERDFSRSDVINSYEAFEVFLNEVIHELPSFPMMEDYVPEMDWGDVQIYHNGNNYKMMYGGEIEHTYDFLESFKVLYCSMRKNIQEVTKRDPVEELENCLKIQTSIINGIGFQPPIKHLIKRIKPGLIEIPSKEFWENAVAFLKQYRISDNFNASFLDLYSVKLNSFTIKSLQTDFENLAFSGRMLDKLFLKGGSQYFLLLPRNYATVILNAWEEVIKKNYDKILSDDISYNKLVGQAVYRYIESRVRTQSVFPFVCAINKDGRPDETVFCSAFVSKNKLFLIYVTKPPKENTELSATLKSLSVSIKKAHELIALSPLRIGLLTKQQTLEFESIEGKNLEPQIIVLMPMFSPTAVFFDIPKALPAKIIFLDQFLGIIDELTDIDQLSEFMSFVEENLPEIKSMNDNLDLFTTFKVSKGVLIRGATTYNAIFLDPHTGSNERYKTLSEFWKKYNAPTLELFGDPREWFVEKETQSRTRFVSRSKFESIITCKIGSTDIFISSPFVYQEKKQIDISNLLMECLENTLSIRGKTIEKHTFFNNFKLLLITIIPKGIVENNPNFVNLKNLHISSMWSFDHGFFKSGLPSIRVIYDEEKTFEAFKETTDDSYEIALLKELLIEINYFNPDKNISSILAKVAMKSSKPRFKMHLVEKLASFPEFEHYQEPTDTHYKLARKKVAELSRNIGLKKGYYKSEIAKIKINQLKKKLIQEIDSIVASYDLTSSIPFLLSKIDCLTHTFEMDRLKIELSQQTHQVGYNREDEFATKHKHYVTLHRDTRYLIEKTVQISPSGQKTIEFDEYCYLVALINWLNTLYQASDSLHYGIFSLGVTVSDEFLFKVVYSGNHRKEEDLYFKEQAALLLGIKGADSDRLESPNIIQYLENLDAAFRKDMGFGFRNMVTLLQVLSFWADYNETVSKTCYSAKKEEILEVCKKNIIDFQQSELEPILSFLSLRKEDALRILGEDKPSDDLPIWEHNKRYSRYTLKPLIPIGDVYHWGPYSAMKTSKLWANQLSSALLPYDLQGSNILKVIDEERKLLEDKLEKKTFEITKRYTKYSSLNLQLNNFDKAGNHPRDLGDYDVLCFIQEKNIILNVECKFIPPVYCPKDLHRLRKKIREIYLPKISKRQNYLENNRLRIMKALKWPIQDKPPKVIPIFLSQQAYWFTRLSYEKFEPKYIQIDLLGDFITGLKEHVN